MNRTLFSAAIGLFALLLGSVIAIPLAMLAAADDHWNPPHAAHIRANDFSAYCVHDDKETMFVIAYHGDFSSATESSANAKTRSWTDSGTLTMKKPGIAIGFHRTHTSPNKVTIFTTPSEGRDLAKPAPPPSEFGQTEYDLTKGRVFVLNDSGAVRQFDIATPLVTDQSSANKLAALIAAIPPQEREAIDIPDDQYVKSGFPLDELAGDGVMWNDVQNGLSLGYRISGDEWRVLGKEVTVELWVRNPGDMDVKFQSNMRSDIGLRLTLKDETGVNGAKEWEHQSHIVPSDVPPMGELRLLPPGHAFKVKEFAISLLRPENDVSGIKGHFFPIEPGAYNFRCELELPGFTAVGEGGKQLTPAADEWTGKLTTRGLLKIMVVATDAPASKPRMKSVEVRISKDGEISLERVKLPLGELKTRAARNANKRFMISADEDVPYAKVVEVVESLKAAGVTEFSFTEARVGDGKYRVANLQATYKFDDKHGFSICRPRGHAQWFTVSWPAEGNRPSCALRTYPNVSDQTDGKWAVVWEPDTDVLWWVDDADVGKMTLTDPFRVIVDREGRTNSFSRDFGLPEEVKTEFRRLGFVIGRDKTPALEVVIGGNSGGGQTIVSAEFGWWTVEGTVTDANGKPLADVPVRVSSNQVLKTEKTDAKGKYRVSFSMNLQQLAKWRGVTVERVLEGFTERDMAQAGKFNALLRIDEQPQFVRLADDNNFQPGPIPRFTENDLLPSQQSVTPGKQGRADFVMLKASEIVGGDRPIDAIVSEQIRYVGIDGRLSDLSSNQPEHVMPLISDNWGSHFRWRGVGEMPVSEREKLTSIVEQAHQKHRLVRFWAIPDNEVMWQAMRDAGVDLINTDNLEGLSRFLHAQD